jgi:hypothetical protein
LFSRFFNLYLFLKQLAYPALMFTLPTFIPSYMWQQSFSYKEKIELNKQIKKKVGIEMRINFRLIAIFPLDFLGNRFPFIRLHSQL